MGHELVTLLRDGSHVDEPVHAEFLDNEEAERATAEAAVRRAVNDGFTQAEAEQLYGYRGVAKYDPNQPRAPQGTREGGRWVRGGASSASDDDNDKGTYLAPLDPNDVPEHIKNLKLPPAWTDVFYNEDPDGDLLAIGKDAKGRDQYVYSEKYMEGQMRAKFARIKELDGKYDAIRAKVGKDQGSTDSNVRDHGDVTALLMDTGLRPGSTRDRGGAKRAYGATTLEGRHVKVGDDGTVRLVFTGKKGVALDLPIEDKAMADMLKRRADMSGPKGKLFPNVTDKSLRDYVDGLDGGQFSPKDFRTYLGTTMARDMVETMSRDKFSSLSAYKKAVREVATYVSQKLGNTPTVALQSYIDPQTFLPWRAQLAIKDMGFDVWFGEVSVDDFNWRDHPAIVDPDDEELDPTPPDVVAALGFDPKDA